MNKFLFSVIFLCPLISLAQETKKVVIKTKDPDVKEEFYVLKDRPEIKHGPYSKVESRSSEKGQYENNVKSGVWEYHDHSGAIVQKIDFTKHEVILAKEPSIVKESWLLVNGEPKEYTQGTQPLMLGFPDRFISFFSRTMRYPADARRGGVMGEVFLSATITKEGVMIDEKVESGPGHGLNEEALRVVQLYQGEWFPLMIDGEAKDARVIIVIKFKLA